MGLCIGLLLLVGLLASAVPVRQKQIPLLSREFLLQAVSDAFQETLRINVLEMSLSREEMEQKMAYKTSLRRALRRCGMGDLQAKAYVQEMIQEILVHKCGVNEDNLGQVLPYTHPDRLSDQDCMDILLFIYSGKYGEEAMEQMMKEMYGQAQPVYEVKGSDVRRLYQEKSKGLVGYPEALKVLVRQIYGAYKGFGPVDVLLEQKIDGVSGGVSGLTPEDFTRVPMQKGSYAHDSVWMYYHGVSVHLSCLTFGSQAQLERICKNIYRYRAKGQLTEANGYKVNEMLDGSRVVVCRPPFCESWVFFVRKFDSVEHKTLPELLKDRNWEYPAALLQWLIQGCQNVAITGSQGTGKTTLLMALVGFIHPSYTLRIQEMAFELHLRRTYPFRNIVTFRETDTVSGQEGLDLQKKTDGCVNILGEVASAPVASYMIQMATTASLFTVFTHHAKTTDHLITAMRNALLSQNIFTNEKIAQNQVVDVLQFDVHLNHMDGHRYIDRVTEICTGRGEGDYEIRELICWQEGTYLLKNLPSQKALERMEKAMRKEDRSAFLGGIKEWETCLS